MSTFKHHIIPFHEWRQRINPKAKRSDTDFNAPDNVVFLTLEQHIQAHQLLYELNHNRYDEIAYQCMSGMIGNEDAAREAVRQHSIGNKYNLGKTRGPELREADAAIKRGMKATHEQIETNRAAQNRPEVIAAKREKQLGRKRTLAHRIAISAGLLGNTHTLGKKHGPAFYTKLQEYWTPSRRKKQGNAMRERMLRKTKK